VVELGTEIEIWELWRKRSDNRSALIARQRSWPCLNPRHGSVFLGLSLEAQAQNSAMMVEGGRIGNTCCTSQEAPSAAAGLSRGAPLRRQALAFGSPLAWPLGVGHATSFPCRECRQSHYISSRHTIVTATISASMMRPGASGEVPLPGYGGPDRLPPTNL